MGRPQGLSHRRGRFAHRFVCIYLVRALLPAWRQMAGLRVDRKLLRLAVPASMGGRGTRALLGCGATGRDKDAAAAFAEPSPSRQSLAFAYLTQQSEVDWPA
jgi:hypothetical protein